MMGKSMSLLPSELAPDISEIETGELEPERASVYKVVRILQDGESVALNVGEGEPLPVDAGPWLP